MEDRRIILGIVWAFNRVSKVDRETPFLVRNSVLVFVDGIAGVVCFNCACDGSDVLMLMDRRLEQKVKPTLDCWNSAVFAEFRLLELLRISQGLNLWKQWELEAESLM